MTIKNGTMVKFLNTSDALLAKRLPVKLYFALSANLKTFGGLIQAYQEAYEKVKDDQKELIELVNQDIDVQVQTVKRDVLELIDDNPKFDSITYDEYGAIAFMIED